MKKVITQDACRCPIGMQHADGYLSVTVKCEVVGEVVLPQPQEKKATPWTPPPLYPDMKEETFKALPYHEQVIVMETAEARDERRRKEAEEIQKWEVRYPKIGSANSQSRQCFSTNLRASIPNLKSA